MGLLTLELYIDQHIQELIPILILIHMLSLHIQELLYMFTHQHIIMVTLMVALLQSLEEGLHFSVSAVPLSFCVLFVVLFYQCVLLVMAERQLLSNIITTIHIR